MVGFSGVLGGVGVYGSSDVTAPSIVLGPCPEGKRENERNDMTMMQTAARQTIATRTHLRLKKGFKLSVRKGLVWAVVKPSILSVLKASSYADVWEIALGFAALASARRLCANG